MPGIELHVGLREPGQPLVSPGSSWLELEAGFRWPDWRHFNIAEACCDVWARAEPNRPAVRIPQPDGGWSDCSYRQLSLASRRLANLLAAHGVGRGDRVGVLLPQCLETVLTHLAIYRLGAVAVPLFTLFGEDGLRFRLADSGACALVTDLANFPKVDAIREDLADLLHIFLIDGTETNALDLWQALASASDDHDIIATGPEDPAFISYTSGTTGQPKGALHGHRVLIGHLPCIALAHDFLGAPGDCIWTPADWAWMGGLTNVLLPSLYYGVPVVAHRAGKFDPEAALRLMRNLEVRNAFFPPTALKLLRESDAGQFTGLRTMASAGESLGGELLDWVQGAFGLTVNEFYGQTECNAVIGNSSALFPVRSGSAGRRIPGHHVAILSKTGTEVPRGEIGEIAVRSPDPTMFLGYWNNPAKTEEIFSGPWLRTGDEGMMDEDGYVFFRARADDVITSSGYRIGPGEIEECLLGHPAVAMAAVVGVPDRIRTERVKAFVVPRVGINPEGLDAALIARVRERLSPHVAPRDVIFVDSLPLTPTGKIQRRVLRQQG